MHMLHTVRKRKYTKSPIPVATQRIILYTRPIPLPPLCFHSPLWNKNPTKTNHIPPTTNTLIEIIHGQRYPTVIA